MSPQQPEIERFAPESVDHYVEIRGLYDGWSVAVLKDGRILNRWEPGDWQYKEVEQWIDLYRQKHAKLGERDA